jgi:ABC-type sugar transport system permease subunit
MPSLPSPETTMTLAGVGMVRFVIIPTLLSFSFSFSEESFFETKEEFCVCEGFRELNAMD